MKTTGIATITTPKIIAIILLVLLSTFSLSLEAVGGGIEDGAAGVSSENVSAAGVDAAGVDAAGAGATANPIASAISSEVASSAIPSDVASPVVLTVNAFSIQAGMALIITSLLYIWLMGNLRFSLSTAIIACLFALFTFFGMLLNSDAHSITFGAFCIGDVEVTSRVLRLLVVVLALFGDFAFFYACLLLAYCKICRHSKQGGDGESDDGNCSGDSDVLEEGARDDGSGDGASAIPNITIFGQPITYAICIIVMLVAWLPYIIYFFPGAASSDTSAHLAQYFGVDGKVVTTHFPYLTAVLYGQLYQLGTTFDPSGYAGMFLMVLAQIALGVFVFSAIVVWMARLSAPKWLVIGSLAFFALFPAVPTFMMLAVKDTLHSELIALFTLQMVLFFAIRSEGAQRTTSPASKPVHPATSPAPNATSPASQTTSPASKTAHPATSPARPATSPEPQTVLASPWAIGVVAILVALTRNNGLFLVVCALLLLGLLLHSKRTLVTLGVVVVVVVTWQLAAMPLFGVQAEGPKEALSAPLQIVGRMSADGVEITPDEQAIIDASFKVSYEELGQLYNPLLSDPIKTQHLRLGSAEEADFLITVAQLSLEHPISAMSGALATTYGTWYPFCLGTYYPDDNVYINQKSDPWAAQEWFGSFDQLDEIRERFRPGNELLTAAHNLPGLSFLYQPATYTWLVLFILGLAIFARKPARSERTTASAQHDLQPLRVAIPITAMFLALAAIDVLGPCSSFRYMLPACFSLPVLLLLSLMVSGHVAQRKSE